MGGCWLLIYFLSDTPKMFCRVANRMSAFYKAVLLYTGCDSRGLKPKMASLRSRGLFIRHRVLKGLTFNSPSSHHGHVEVRPDTKSAKSHEWLAKIPKLVDRALASQDRMQKPIANRGGKLFDTQLKKKPIRQKGIPHQRERTAVKPHVDM